MADEYAVPRRFVRHTADVPIEISAVEDAPRMMHGVNVSIGGLSFVSTENFPLGTVIHVRIPSVTPPFDARARVVWIMPEGDEYCVGVEFLDEADSFRVRMVEQVCAIDEFKRRLEQEEGRSVTRDEAAREWIRRYAGRFPGAEDQAPVTGGSARDAAGGSTRDAAADAGSRGSRQHD
jgi:hypothetical protein